MKPQSQPASATPAPEVNEFDAHGQGPYEEDKDEPEWRFKYCKLSYASLQYYFTLLLKRDILDQLKHSLAETNWKLELVTKDLDVLSQVVSKFADVKPTASPEPKMWGGRSAVSSNFFPGARGTKLTLAISFGCGSILTLF